MLPLVSSITTTVIGVGWLSKLVSVCGLALSRTSKSSLVEVGHETLLASVTVTYSGTVCVVTLMRCAPAGATRRNAAAAAVSQRSDGCVIGGVPAEGIP